jgi:hypothetical protein
MNATQEAALLKQVKETHESVVSIAAALKERCPAHAKRMDAIEGDVKEINDTLNGNGRMGLKTQNRIILGAMALFASPFVVWAVNWLLNGGN